MVYGMLIYRGSSLHLEWSSLDIQAVLWVFPFYANVQLSRASEHPLWACHNNPAEAVLTIFVRGLEPNVLVTSWA